MISPPDSVRESIILLDYPIRTSISLSVFPARFCCHNISWTVEQFW